MDYTLIILLLTSQSILWISYIIMIKKYDLEIFWGNIEKKYRYSFLLFASIAYFMNLCIFIYYIFYKQYNKNNIYLSLLIFYGLQLFFLPSMVLSNKLIMKILLFICIFPMLYLVYDIYKYEIKGKKLITKIFLYIFTIIPFLHVFINDFIRFGIIGN